MQDHKEFAKKNGIKLLESGKCQFCGADVNGGVAECIDLFNQGFDSVIDFSSPENVKFKFLSVDAHTLQHPEVHGRWNNHFHLTRLHLIVKNNIICTYELTPKLSRHLRRFKRSRLNEYLTPPKPLERGELTIAEVVNGSVTEADCKKMIEKWASGVYSCWRDEFMTIEEITNQYVP